MATSNEQQSFVLGRASRATRGKRMTKLLDDELEDDEQFWNQDALKEEEDDTNYEEEKEAVDVFDSDFDEDEPEADEEVENDADVRVRTKKRLMFPGKTAPKRKTKKKVLSKLETKDEESSHKQQTSPSEHDDLEGEKIMRKSTRTSVIVRQAERDAIRAALQATMKSHPGSESLKTERVDGWNMLEVVMSTVVATGDSQAGISVVASDLIGSQTRVEEDTDYPYDLDADGTPTQSGDLPSEDTRLSETSTGTRRKRVREDGSSSRASPRSLEFRELTEKISQIGESIHGMYTTYRKATESIFADPWDALKDIPEFDIQTKLLALRMLKEKNEDMSFLRMSLEARARHGCS